MGVLGRVAGQLAPPLFSNGSVRRRLIPYALVEMYRLSRLKGSGIFFRDELVAQLAAVTEINELFPEDRLRDHYVYGNIRDTVDNPDIYSTQLRFYHVYKFFQSNFPEVFEDSTAVLDVGDTSGVLFQAMNRKGTSLNINQECVDFINNKGIEAVRGNAENLEFDDNSFDYVFCFQMLEHVPNPLRVLSELGRVARKKIFLSIPYRHQTKIYNLSHWIDLKEESWKESDVRDVDCHIFEFSTHDLVSLLSHVGLSYETNFPIDYFLGDSLKRRLLNKRFESYFNFFVLKPMDSKNG